MASRLTVTDVKLTEVQCHPANARVSDLDPIKESIMLHGLYTPIVVQRSTGNILVGNHRYMAASALGFDSIPVHYLDVDDEEALRILLVDNRTSDMGGYDEDALLEIIHSLPDLTGTGYTQEDLDRLEGIEPDPLDSGHEENYVARFEIVVECRDEAHQEATFQEITKLGYRCRLLSL